MCPMAESMKIHPVAGLVLLFMLASGVSAGAGQPASGGLIGTRVIVDNFAIDVTEVTVGQIRQRLAPGNKATKAERDGGGYEYDAGWQQRPGWFWHAPYGAAAADSEPAVHVTWYEATDHCRAVGGRLPTFSQWRVAAYTERRENPTDGFIRGRRYEYPVGDQPAGMNTAGEDDWPRHAPAANSRRGINGLYDMGANVWEWLADVDGDRALTAGGSWWYGAQKTTEQGAQYKPRDFAAVYIGFRCVYELKQQD